MNTAHVINNQKISAILQLAHCDLAGIELRPLVISYGFGKYGACSSALIEVVGSPPRGWALVMFDTQEIFVHTNRKMMRLNNRFRAHKSGCFIRGGQPFQLLWQLVSDHRPARDLSIQTALLQPEFDPTCQPNPKHSS